MKSRHIALLDFYFGGHHPRYIQMLMEFWAVNHLEGRLDVVVTPVFVQHHPQIRDWVNKLASKNVRLVQLETVPPHPSASGSKEIIDNDRAHGRAIESYISDHRPDHVVMLYFDHVQVSLAFDMRSHPGTTLSGIYFRPSFHYKHFGGSSVSIQTSIHDFAKKTLLRLSLRNRRLTHLFCLDPYSVPYISRFSGRVTPVMLPDGVQALTGDEARYDHSPLEAADKDRKIILLYGAIDSRKGIIQVLKALQLLDAPYQKKVCLVSAGPILEQERSWIENQLNETLCSTATQIIVDDQYLDTPQIVSYLVKTDLVLTTYQQHVGSSNVLIQAAALGKPVLGSDYGVVGEHIRNHHLGKAIDAGSPETIAHALQEYIDDPASLKFDPVEARRFASGHSAEKFAATIFKHIGFTIHETMIQETTLKV